MFNWEIELVLRIQCPFDFSYYPFDNQECSVKFASYFHTDDVIKYITWQLEDISGTIQQALEYDIKYKIISSQNDLKHKYFTCKECNYSVSGFNVKLNRKLGPAFINIYIPSHSASGSTKLVKQN